MNFLIRTAKRITTGLIVLTAIWLSVTQIFDRLEERMPVFLAAACTYFISAYILFPRIIQFTLFFFRRFHIPRFTRAKDGLTADPVNIILLGSEAALQKAFTKAGWHQSDALHWKSWIKMVRAFINNKPYPTAPFSSLYLFGRPQDIGFQQPIGHSPRQRHHVRFWATNTDTTIEYDNKHYWNQKQTVDHNKPVMWVGAATKDIGFGLTRITLQISHATDRDVDEEREYILSTLRKNGLITEEHYVESNEFVVGKYTSDGRIVVARLHN